MEVDLLDAAARLAIGLDGNPHRADAEAYRRDRRKDGLLQEPGYPVPPFLADDRATRPDPALEAILRALAPQQMAGDGRPRQPWRPFYGQPCFPRSRQSCQRWFERAVSGRVEKGLPGHERLQPQDAARRRTASSAGTWRIYRMSMRPTLNLTLFATGVARFLGTRCRSGNAE